MVNFLKYHQVRRSCVDCWMNFMLKPSRGRIPVHRNRVKPSRNFSPLILILAMDFQKLLKLLRIWLIKLDRNNSKDMIQPRMYPCGEDLPHFARVQQLPPSFTLTGGTDVRLCVGIMNGAVPGEPRPLSQRAISSLRSGQTAPRPTGQPSAAWR